MARRPDEPNEEPRRARRYIVEFTEPALAEADAAYLWLSKQADPEYAVRWYEGLFVAAQTLSFQPRMHAIAPENDLYDVEVRRMLYHGPSGRRRRGGAVYRLLFHIVEPAEGEPRDGGVVRILHVWHGARRPLV